MFDKLPVPCATLDTMLSVRCVLAHKPAPPTTVALISHLAPICLGFVDSDLRWWLGGNHGCRAGSSRVRRFYGFRNDDVRLRSDFPRAKACCARCATIKAMRVACAPPSDDIFRQRYNLGGGWDRVWTAPATSFRSQVDGACLSDVIPRGLGSRSVAITSKDRAC